MSRSVSVDGRFAPYARAQVHVEDRGLQFADSVYEVWAVLDGRLADYRRHLARLKRSLGEIALAWPIADAALLARLREAIRRNRVRNGLVYLQITRGVARRDPYFPPPGTKPTTVIIARPVDWAAAERRAETGVAVITTPDARWARCDIKSTGLLPNVLAKADAQSQGAREAWFVGADGRITEGASTNAWIVDGEGTLRTAPLSPGLLPGVTRAVLIELARDEGLRVEEAAFTPDEVRGAREAFLTAASAFVTPVVSIDGALIGNGGRGPVATRLRELYLRRARNTLV